LGDIKWIPLEGVNLSAANLACAEKLRRFGFAVCCGEFGSEKFTKAGLCVYDVLQEKKDPDILLITSNQEMYAWYRILMTSFGADFKIITGAANSLLFFSPDCPNLYIMSSDALGGDNALRKKAGDDFVWDLIVIDEEHGSAAPDYRKYSANIPWKCGRMLIMATVPAASDADKEGLSSLIKGKLTGEAPEADKLSFGIGSSAYNSEDPVMRYYDEKVYRGTKRSVIFKEYEFDESVLGGLRRKVEIRSGVPAYRFGGNIFEEYDCGEEQKRLYRKNIYTRSDVEDLCAFDKKLKCFLELMDEITADENNRAMVYCSDKNTADYLNKVLSCVYKGMLIRVARGELIRSENIIRKLRVDDSAVFPRIIIGGDELGAVGDGFDRINYIINYELPSTAATLERRMTRHGFKGEADRKFVIFRDKNKQFDSRILDEILFGTVYDAFCGLLPTRNILFDIEGRGEHLRSAVSKLKYILSYASEVDNCMDLIKKTKCDYCLLGAQSVSNGKQLAEFAKNRLLALYKAFGLSDSSTDDDISAAAEALSGLCVINDGRIEKVSDEELSKMAESFSGEGYKELPFASEAIKGFADAKSFIDELHEGGNFHLAVKEQLAALTDCIQYPVLFGIWRYRVREQGSKKSFEDYIRIYNEGIDG